MCAVTDDKLKSFGDLREKFGIPPKGDRVDGRHSNEMRPVSIDLNFHRPHQVLVSYGNTRVICAASIENRVPQWRYGSGLGWLTAEYSMLPNSTERRTAREKGINVSGRTYEIQRLIGRALRGVTRLGSLGQCSVYIDCDVVSADGGTRSASITGGFLALYSLMKGNEKRFPVWPIVEPLCAVSVGIVKGEMMLDLAYEEDSAAQVDGCAVFLKSGRLVDFFLSGEEASFTTEELASAVELAKCGCDTIFETMSQKLAEIDAIYVK